MIKISTNIFFATLLFSACTIRTGNNTDNSKPLTVAADTASIKFQCPMKDQHDTCYTTAGECPVCGMDLEKK